MVDGASPWRTAGSPVSAADLASHPSDDVARDIRLMLDRLRACGLARVIAVDVSPPDLPVHVVRMLVPGLESWFIDRSRIGRRATAAWNAAAAALEPVR
jgi:ribosomal protein S12 methylthiotransferase accessory factor